MKRIPLLLTTLASIALIAGSLSCSASSAEDDANGGAMGDSSGDSSGSSFVENFEVDPADPTFELTDEEWREQLTDDEYHVLRQEGTEPAFSGDLYGIEKEGTYKCAGCGKEIFSSDTRFDSGTGWPSFWAPIGEDAIGTAYDDKLPQTRIEVHCGRCASHLGHVFPDGPDDETGLRYCLNSVALDFEESE